MPHSSPPPRAPRSPHSSTYPHAHVRPSPSPSSSRALNRALPPPLPGTGTAWDTPTSYALPMPRSKHVVLSPQRAAPPPPTPPVPPLPSSPALGIYSISSPPPVPYSPHARSNTAASTSISSSSFSNTSITRSLSTSSSSSASSSYSQEIATPSSSRRTSTTISQSSASPRSKSRLLPALPLSINTQLTPQSLKSKRVAVDYSALPPSSPIGLDLEEVQIVISRDRKDNRARSRAQSISSAAASLAAYPTPPFTGSAISLIDPTPIERSPNRSSNRRSATFDTSTANNISSVPALPGGLGGPGGTPPRPARRAATLAPSPSSFTSKRSSLSSIRRASFIPTTELLPPQPDYARSISPSGDSISTITISPASTPRPLPTEQADKRAAPPQSSHTLASAIDEMPISIQAGGRKRDSAQRRLSALRGLMANLDFNQPWSFSDKPSENSALGITDEEATESSDPFGASPGDHQHQDGSVTNSFIVASSSIEASLASPAQPTARPQLVTRASRPVGMINPDIAESHGWPTPPRIFSPVISSPERQLATPISPSRANSTPVRRNSLSRRQPSSTPPRRPKQFRSSSELLSRTPEPPRPASRPRKEVFDVASSGYSKSLEQEPASPPLPATPTSTWRSSLSNDDVYQRLMQHQGPMEVKRQEIMWEMCETEQSFIRSMRTVLRLFATPLKTPQGKWIDGIPPKIADLFDSLEGIAHAHGIVSASQRDMRRRNEVVDVPAFVAMFKGWVTRLEVHEWYLLKFEAVVAEVEENVRDPDSVFGEFVRMQMKEEVLGSMSLGSMLLKPVQRLTKYPLFLKRLLDATPHPHPAQPEILSLLSITESIILTLQAIKAREEDFEQLQFLEARLTGLPEGFTLAVPGRKLIGQGIVSRVQPSRDIIAASSSTTTFNRTRANSLHSSRGSISSTVSSSAPSSASSMSPWDFSASLTPSTCRTSAFSVSSTSSSYCSGPPSRSNSINRTSASPSISGSIANLSPSRVIRSPSSASFVERPHTPSSSKRKNKEEALTMLVFDDLVVLAQGVQEKSGLFMGKKRSEKSLRVLGEMEAGVGKVAEVRDWSGWGGHSSLFSLTIVPISHTARDPHQPITHVFTLPSSGASSIPPSPSAGSIRSLRSVPNVNLNLSCPVLNTLPAFLSTLREATTSVMAGGVRGSAHVEEGQEMMDCVEAEGEGEAQWGGYAA